MFKNILMTSEMNGVAARGFKKHFTTFVEKDTDGVFIVSCPLFQGCRSYGKTMDEALRNIQEVIDLCLEE